jgi:large subunit ribosomal protein L10e
MPYTRKEYVHGTPAPKISIFEMGDPKNQYDTEIVLRSIESGTLSDKSLEALRIHVNRALGENISKYYYKINLYPHTILRGKKWLAFAGADRISSGMRKSFGKPSGRAVRVKKNQVIATIHVDRADRDYAKKLLKSVAPKLATPCRIEINEISR